MTETPEVALLGALRRAEAELSDRLVSLQATDHSVEDRRRELVTSTAERDQAVAYNLTIRRQNDDLAAQVAHHTSVRAALDREIRTKTEVIETLDMRLGEVAKEHTATLASVRGELVASMTPEVS